jgi:hypothetical protein
MAAVYGTTVGVIVRQPRPHATGTFGALLSSNLDFEGTAQGNKTKAGQAVLGQER